MSFSGDIKRFTEKAEKAALMVFRGAALEVTSAIIRRTPVMTGRLRGNWQTQLNRAPSGTVTSHASKALSRSKAETSRANLTDSIYMVNNLPYAEVIERGRVGNKGSEQAPQGMVAVTVNDFKRAVARHAKRNKA